MNRLAFERSNRPCVVCGTPFYAPPSAFEKDGRKVCGLVCRDLLNGERKREDPVIRFWRKVSKTDGCWERGGAHLDGGYSAFHDGERPLGAHRFAWIVATGDVLTTEDVIGHICDNPPCVRNDEIGVYEVRGVLLPRRGHLFKGTDADNNADMVAKHRHRHFHHAAREFPCPTPDLM